MRIRPLAAVAAAALTVGVAGPAMAGSTAKPPAGSAKSGLTLLSVALAGHDIRVGSVALVSDTVSGKPTSSVVVTPLRADGKAYGEQSVTAANSPASVPSFDSSAALPSALSTVVSVKSPVFNVSSSTGSAASSKAGAASLGSVSVLGIPVKLDGSVDVSSLVDGTNAAGQKTITVKNLALPSVADLLKALGLDLPKVPVKTLTDLLNQLNLTNTAVTTAQAALTTAEQQLGAQLTSAQKAVDDTQAKLAAAKDSVIAATSALTTKQATLTAAQPAVAAAQQAVTTASGAVTQAQATLDSATSALTALAGLVPLSTFVTLHPTDPAVQAYTAAQSALSAANAAAAKAATDLTSAQSVAQAAQAAVSAAQTAVNSAQALVSSLTSTLQGLLSTLNGLLGQVAPQVNALLAAVTAVLDSTPLASIDSFTVQTQSMAKSASPGGQVAKVVGGEIQGVHVLGTDVLSNVLGKSSINVTDLAGSTLSQVTSKIAALNGVLSSVLSAVPGLSIPAPTVQLLTKSTSTGIANGFGTAEDSVRALSVTIPAITLPASLALPNAASLPAITGAPDLKGALGIAAVGDLTSQAVTMSVGTLSEQAAFRPGAAGTTTTPPGTTPGTKPTVHTPQLPRTGLPASVAVLGLLLLGTGLVVRRRFATEG